ncbi:MAG: pentapeptide repeat-containing protein [Candidatus Theseobacter exili]|nr:pentapeptide repeat-containing protein [Candidatus Theseobacter exili]
MSKNLVFMKGAEFIRKILSGERNFSGIELEEGFDLCGDDGFDELQKYLRKSDLKGNPISIEGAKLRHLDADGLYVPFLKAKGVNLKHAALMGANLEKAQLETADLRYARLSRAMLSGANLKDADLRLADLNLASLIESILSGADFEAVDLEYTNMAKADLKGIKNLQWARFLKTVNFQFADITGKEKEIIRQALWAEESKKRRIFGGSG